MAEVETFIIEEKSGRTHGLTAFKAWFFIVGEMAGCGALVYANKIFDVVTSTALLMVVAFLASYSGNHLADCWAFMVKSKEYKHLTDGNKEPYPTMAFAAFGKKGMVVSRICVMVTLVFVTAIFAILSCENIVKLMDGLGYPGMCECTLMIFVIIGLTPFTWLPTPSDSWLLAFIAAASTIVSFICIAVQAYRDGSSSGIEVYNALATSPNSSLSKPFFDIPGFSKNDTSFMDIIGLLVVYIFGFGGMSMFPTVQSDMKDPSKFPKVVSYSIATLVFLYCLVMIPGYLNYSVVQENIIKNLNSQSMASMTANFLITLHLVFALILVANPPMQAVESYYMTSNSTVYNQRVIRSLCMLALLAFINTVPKFPLIMSFIGATTIMTNTFIMPSLIYLRIIKDVNFSNLQDFGRTLRTNVDAKNLFLTCAVVLLGCFGMVMGLLSTYELAVAGGGFVQPCWYNAEATCPRPVEMRAGG